MLSISSLKIKTRVFHLTITLKFYFTNDIDHLSDLITMIDIFLNQLKCTLPNSVERNASTVPFYYFKCFPSSRSKFKAQINKAHYYYQHYALISVRGPIRYAIKEHRRNINLREIIITSRFCNKNSGFLRN